jgi:hypothetical protein
MDITLNLCDICEVIYQFTILSLCGAFYSHITLAYLLGMGFLSAIILIQFFFKSNIHFTFLTSVPTMALTNIHYEEGKCIEWLFTLFRNSLCNCHNLVAKPTEKVFGPRYSHVFG